MKKPINRYIPSNYRKVTYEGTDCVAYVGENDDRTQFYAILYKSKAKNHSGHYRYKSEESRNKSLVRWFDAQIDHKNRVKEQQKKRNSYEHTLELGEILVSTWGYDQTNVDFYQVVEINSKKTVTIRKIASEAIKSAEMPWAQAKVVPCRGQFVGQPMKKRVAEGDHVKLTSYSWAGRWDFNAVHETSYA